MLPFQTRPNATTVHFGAACSGAVTEFELDFGRLELRRLGTPVDVRRQAIQVLALLVHQEGRLVTTDELRRRLWGDQQLGWRNSLHQCVRDLRRALSDDARNPRFVVTVARTGYRFVGTRSTRKPHSVKEASCDPRKFRGLFRRPTIAFAAGFGLALLLPASFLIVCAVFAG